MKYELAKELKENGFPLRRKGVGFVCDVLHTGFIIDDIEYYDPTLSELIEAIKCWVKCSNDDCYQTRYDPRMGGSKEVRDRAIEEWNRRADGIS